MAKHKVPIAGTIGKSVVVDTEATNGATLGVNLFLPNGTLPTLAQLKAYLGITGATSGGNGNGGPVTHHRLLQGLTVGDDHPQYTQHTQSETITGQWQFSTSVWGPNGAVATPAFTFTGDLNTGMYRIGADILGFATGGVERMRLGAAGQLGVAGANYGNATDALQSTGTTTAPAWTPTGPRYLTQTDDERFWTADEFVRGHNIIGVRHAGEAFVYLPNDLPTERLISVKDETGVGPVTVRIY